MTFTILTIYKLFFITQEDILFALTKDGRIIKVKNTPYFSALSSDGKILSGISFDGEYTHIFSQTFGFSDTPISEIASLFGYFYYPSLNSNYKKMALIEADLLKPRPQGELCIYQKKIKKWYKQSSIDAKMKQPLFLPDDSLLFIDSEGSLSLYKTNDTPIIKIASNTQLFNASSDGKNAITFDGEKITVYDLKTLEAVNSFSANYVTALFYDNNNKEVIYATSYENRHAIYHIDLKTLKPQLLTQTQDPVILIGA